MGLRSEVLKSTIPDDDAQIISGPDLQMIGGQVARPSKRPSKRIRVQEEQAEDDDVDCIAASNLGDGVSSEGFVVAFRSSG